MRGKPLDAEITAVYRQIRQSRSCTFAQSNSRTESHVAVHSHDEQAFNAIIYPMTSYYIR